MLEHPQRSKACTARALNFCIPRHQVRSGGDSRGSELPTHGKTEPWRFVVLGRAAQEELLDLSLKVLESF
jgi:hypothetical protein